MLPPNKGPHSARSFHDKSRDRRYYFMIEVMPDDMLLKKQFRKEGHHFVSEEFLAILVTII